jgi:Flp pilus assembly protein TadD
MGAKCLVAVVVLALSLAAIPAQAVSGTLKVPLPKRSHLTPVQQLNREGVDAIQKHQYDKARTYFYKAYLYDPDDPFTLNNLGYVAELDGQVERAHKFYSLASQMATDAIVDRASSKRVQGKPMSAALGSAQDRPMQVNRMNVEAVRLLGQGRSAEADLVLQQNLKLDPHSPFTLNNMGVAKEGEGDLDAALRYYTQAADSQSDERAVVTLNHAWKGKPIREMAAANADKVRETLSAQGSLAVRVETLNMRGVAAINRNDWDAARKAFQQAYALNPNDAFSINNLGYLSEMDGDLESAQFYYEKARMTEGALSRVGSATRRSAEGKPLTDVASTSTESVDARLTQERNARRREGGPILLKRRDNQPVVEPAASPNAPSQLPQSNEPPQSPQRLGPPQPPVPVPGNPQRPQPQETVPPPDTQQPPQ